MTKYLFIDESGDPGDNDGTGTNSKYYTELVLQIDSTRVRDLIKHIINWRYIRGIYAEPKKIHRGGLQRFLWPILELYHSGALKCSCVYLLKANYTGPYLKISSPKGQNPIRFRNYIHRQLLEFHFDTYPAQRTNIDITFDFYRMSKDALVNLDIYLRKICNLPPIDHISHIESEFCLPLQLTSQLVNAILAIQMGKIANPERQMFRFISQKDITTDN